MASSALEEKVKSLQPHNRTTGRPFKLEILESETEIITKGKKGEDGTNYSRQGDWVVERGSRICIILVHWSMRYPESLKRSPIEQEGSSPVVENHFNNRLL